MTETITVATVDGSFNAFVAHPAVEPAPAIVVAHEIFGVNRPMRELAERLAGAGYVAIVGDLFWRIEADAQIGYDDEGMKKAFSFNQRFDDDAGVTDLAAILAAARTMPGTTGAAGVLGLCLGGRLQFLVAARHDPDCAVGFYPVRLESVVDEVDSVRCPMLIHAAGDDAHVPREAIDAVRARLAGHANITHEIYEGSGHAFANPARPTYDADAAELAWQRTLAFLAEHLEP